MILIMHMADHVIKENGLYICIGTYMYIQGP